MSSPVIFFEIGTRKFPRAQKFYSQLFGWKILGQDKVAAIDTQDKVGINGQLATDVIPEPYILVYAQVDSVAETIKNAQALGGGLVLGPAALSPQESFAWIKDPDGNIMGVVGRP